MLKKKYPNVKWSSFIVGCIMMILFAFVIESSIHNIVLNGPIGLTIMNSAFLYALYGGFMAGLFEESGRYIAFQYLLKKEREEDYNAIMYGLGHGGIEMILIYSLSMVSNIVLISVINSGTDITTLAPGEASQTITSAVQTLSNTPSYMYLLGFVERLSALILQVSLSIFVFMGVQHKKYIYVLYAFGIHFLVDFVVAYLSRSGFNMILLEVILLLCSLLIAYFSKQVFKKHHQSGS
ncbi:MAG: YhfC family intramembrane metalloprotease [Solobacterium sp.]|nr:YhfC family intramembrane metalloprotease [Solobacterium sp.]